MRKTDADNSTIYKSGVFGSKFTFYTREQVLDVAVIKHQSDHGEQYRLLSLGARAYVISPLYLR